MYIHIPIYVCAHVCVYIIVRIYMYIHILMNRVAATPESVALLIKEGYRVQVQSGAGAEASYTDAAYSAAGATIVDASSAWGSDIVLKVNGPSLAEVELSRAGGVLVSFIQPAQKPELMEALTKKGMTVIAMDCLPRTISRAQVFHASVPSLPI